LLQHPKVMMRSGILLGIAMELALQSYRAFSWIYLTFVFHFQSDWDITRFFATSSTQLGTPNIILVLCGVPTGDILEKQTFLKVSCFLCRTLITLENTHIEQD